MPYTLAAALALQPQALGFIAATATLSMGHICTAMAPAFPTAEACTVDETQHQAATVAACIAIQPLGRRSGDGRRHGGAYVPHAQIGSDGNEAKDLRL